jgi:hypothetical protein
MPPMAPSASLDRTDECPVCHRGGIKRAVPRRPMRYVYRPEDLVDIKDVNQTWEWFGEWREFTGDITEGALAQSRRAHHAQGDESAAGHEKRPRR